MTVDASLSARHLAARIELIQESFSASERARMLKVLGIETERNKQSLVNEPEVIEAEVIDLEPDEVEWYFGDTHKPS